MTAVILQLGESVVHVIAHPEGQHHARDHEDERHDDEEPEKFRSINRLHFRVNYEARSTIGRDWM